jgi:antirestriction protein
MLNIFVNTWGNYNENGADGGEWITLPMDPETLEAELKKISDAMGDFDPEYCIHDYEWTTEIEPREISEMENIDELNEELQELDGLDEWDQKEIAAAMEAFGYEFKEAHERQQRGCFIFYAGQDLQEVAESIADDCYLYNAPEFLARYFDYDAFARDLSFDGYTETSHGVIIDG